VAAPAATTRIDYCPYLRHGVAVPSATVPEYFRYQSDGKIALIAENGTVLATSASALPTGSWHSVKVICDIDGGIVKYVVNGTAYINWSKGSALGFSLTSIDWGGIAPSKQNPNTTMYWDDIAANDTQDGLTDSGNYFTGEPPDTALKVWQVLANADVSGKTEWTSSGGGAGVYTNWDEGVPNITDYNYSPAGVIAADIIQESDFQSAADVGIPVTDYIWGISLNHYGQYVSGGITPSVARRLSNGASDTQELPSTAFSGDSWSPLHWPYGMRPGGGFMYLGDLDILRAGFRRVGNASARNEIDVSQLYLYVATSPTPQVGQARRKVMVC
jgi:hypothetical protein